MTFARSDDYQPQDQDGRGAARAHRHRVRAQSKVIMCHGVFDIVHPGPCPPSALRQEQGRHPGRQPHRRRAHRQGATIGRFVPQDLRAVQSRRARDGRLRHHRPERDADREHRASSSPTISPRATNTAERRLHPRRRARRSTSSKPTAARSCSRRATSSIRRAHSSRPRRPTIALEKLLMLMEARKHRLRRAARRARRA